LPAETITNRSINDQREASGHDDASTVAAADGAVEVDGPDAVDVAMTPEAAEETSDRLADQAIKARGQRRLRNYPHRDQGG
jgi:hypothetical protein